MTLQTAPFHCPKPATNLPVKTPLRSIDRTARSASIQSRLGYVFRQNLIKASTPERNVDSEVGYGEEFDKGTAILEEINHADIVDLYDSICNTLQFVYLSEKPTMAEIAGRLLGLGHRTPPSC